MLLRKPIIARCVIKPEAIELALKIVSNRWEVMKRTLELRNNLVPEDRLLAARIQSLVKGEREAVERLKADLNGMPYEEIGATTHAGRSYLYGLTKPIIATAYDINTPGTRRRAGGSYRNLGSVIGQYDLGPYHVILDSDAFQTRRVERCHLVPVRNPEVSARHFHHLAYGPDQNKPAHPLEMRTSWCTASFSDIFNSLLGALDFAAMFKIMHRFLCTFNTNSPLVRELPHARRIENENPD